MPTQKYWTHQVLDPQADDPIFSGLLPNFKLAVDLQGRVSFRGSRLPAVIFSPAPTLTADKQVGSPITHPQSDPDSPTKLSITRINILSDVRPEMWDVVTSTWATPPWARRSDCWRSRRRAESCPSVSQWWCYHRLLGHFGQHPPPHAGRHGSPPRLSNRAAGSGGAAATGRSWSLLSSSSALATLLPPAGLVPTNIQTQSYSNPTIFKPNYIQTQYFTNITNHQNFRHQYSELSIFKPPTFQLVNNSIH